MTKIQRLEKYAAQIPSMGGAKLGPYLRRYASEIGEGCITELGVWLGGCTAYLALGLIDAKKRAMIHVYDRFNSSQSEVQKADKQGLKLTPGMSTAGVFDQFLKPFNADIVKHIGPIKGKYWEGGPIALYVDDASKRQPEFDHVRREFFPSIIKGGILFLMDYFYFEKRPNDLGLAYQHEVMTSLPEYDFIDRIPGTSAAIFKKV